MCYINFVFVLAIIAGSASTSLFHEVPKVEIECIITNFYQVSDVINRCTNIVISDLNVPSGKTLLLNLQPGSNLTFKGKTTFGYLQHWAGPLVNVTGENLNIQGAPGSILDGNGPHYWDGKGSGGILKPKFFTINNTLSSTFANISLLNCPRHCVSIVYNKNLTIYGWNVDVSAGEKLGHNTDGFDVADCENITIHHSVVQNQDDCLVVNSGSNMYFHNLECIGGHGLSLSIGLDKLNSYYNQVSNITFENSTVSRSRNGIHFKTHRDAAPGFAENVTYSNIILSEITNYGINVQQDYGRGGSTGVANNNIKIIGLYLNNITGFINGGSGSVEVYVFCGSDSCSNFEWTGVSITGGSKNNTCINCTPIGYDCQ